MREQPKDRERLEHILDAIDTILGRCEGMTREELPADPLSRRDRLGRVGEERCGGEGDCRTQESCADGYPYEAAWLRH